MRATDGTSTGPIAARRSREPPADTPSASERAGAPPSAANRPTPSEEQEALDLISAMRSMEPPLLAARAPAKPNVVACAIALHRRERFADDTEALHGYTYIPWRSRVYGYRVFNKPTVSRPPADTYIPRVGCPDYTYHPKYPNPVQNEYPVLWCWSVRRPLRAWTGADLARG